MRQKFKNFNFNFNIQIAIAMAIAIGLGYLLKLRYATAAGIVTLATVQSTKKETLRVAMKRLISYVIMVVLSIIIFNSLGFNVWAYGLFVFIFGIINSYMGSVEVLSSNAVMATHFLDAGTTDLAMIHNENLIFVIGVGIGVLINILMPVFAMNFKQENKQIDDHIKEAFKMLSEELRGIYIIGNEIVERELSHLYHLNRLGEFRDSIEKLEERILNQQNNLLFTDEAYHLAYLRMRKDQLSNLTSTYETASQLEDVRQESYIIADFIDTIIDQYHETNTVESLYNQASTLQIHFRDSQLPADRKEFETRARLYLIMNQLINTLQLKQVFVSNLTDEMKEKYWMEEKDETFKP